MVKDRPAVNVSYSRGQPYVTLSLLAAANATALPATSGARGTECYRRSVSIVSLVVGVPLDPVSENTLGQPLNTTIVIPTYPYRV